MNSSMVHFLIWFVFSIIILFLSFYNFIAVLKFKIRKLKEDTLSIEKSVIQGSSFIFITFIISIHILNYGDLNLKFVKIILVFYLICVYILQAFIAYESYKQIKDPSFALRSYISQRRVSLKYEITIVLFLLCSFILIYLTFDLTAGNIELIYSRSIYFFSIYFIFSISSIFFYFKKNTSFNNYSVVNQSKAIKRNNREFVTNLFYFLLISYFLTFSILSKFLNEDFINKFNFELFTIIGVYLFIGISLIDVIMTSYCIYKSDFYYYYLGNTRFGCFLRIFGKDVYRKPILSVDYSTFNANIKENSVLYFHNTLSYMIEEHLIDTLDNIINITMASLFIIFNSSSEKNESCNKNYNIKFPSLKDLNNEDEISDFSDKHEKLIDVDITNNNTTTNILEGNNKHENFYFTKKDFSDEKLSRLISLNPDKDSLMVNGGDNSNINLKVEIKSLYNLQFAEFLKKRNINVPNLKDSLISHLNVASPTWNSLLNKNSKEDSFKKQNKLVLNTFDRLLSLEICNDESIFSNEHTTDDFLRKYFNHMESYTKSFLPLILGVYKVKLYDFKELTIVLMKNIIIQEVPKELYNYWQMIRVNRNKQMEMVTSSKDRVSNLIKDEMLFRNELKLNLSDYQGFKTILSNDLKFFQKTKTKEFNLLIMYYEFGQGQANSFDNENTTGGNRLTMGTNNLGIRLSNISKNRPNNFKEPDFEKMPKSSNDSTSLIYRDINLIQIIESNGFEATYNNFRCVLFCVFDNVFERNSWCQSSKHFQDYFFEIMDNFKESNLLE